MEDGSEDFGLLVLLYKIYKGLTIRAVLCKMKADITVTIQEESDCPVH